MADMIDSLPPSLVASFVTYEYLALVALFFVSETAIPLPFPSYVLILYAGFLAQQGQGNVPLILLCAVLGTVLGAWLLYWAASRRGHSLLRRYGSWFDRRGSSAIFMGRLIPGIRCQTSIAAGVFHVRRRVFLCSTAVAALIWTSFYLGMGFLLGNGSGWIAGYLENSYILVALPLAVLAVFVGFKVMRRRHRPGKGATAQPDARLIPAGLTA